MTFAGYPGLWEELFKWGVAFFCVGLLITGWYDILKGGEGMKNEDRND